MTKQFSEFLQNLVSIAPRRGKGEQEACQLILDILGENSIKYETQKFITCIPVTKRAFLTADDVDVPCIGASYLSGEFDINSKILNSFDAESEISAITFNPVSKGVCLQSFKTFPSLSVHRDSIVQLVMANKLSGSVEVLEESFESTNILIGNLSNPRKVIFAHYDSIVGAGAIDNAGSVDVLIQTVIENKGLLEKFLFVFAGSEEESLSSQDGCYGFEVFDQEYKMLLDNVEEILVLDGVGVGVPSFVTTHVDWVFAVSRIDELGKKILWMQNDQTLVMQYYHSELDTLDKLDPKYLQDAKNLLLNRLA